MEPNVDKLNTDKLKKYIPSVLSSLKSKVDNFDIGKLETTAVDLSKLSNVVKNDVVKKTEYNAKIKNIEGKMPDITNLATKTTFNDKFNEVKGEIRSIPDLATTAAFNPKINEVKDKIPNITYLASTTPANISSSSRRLEGVFKSHLEDVFKTTSA